MPAKKTLTELLADKIEDDGCLLFFDAIDMAMHFMMYQTVMFTALTY